MKRVIYIEDDVTAVQLIEELSKKYFDEFYTTANIQTAKTLIKNVKFDLIILDIRIEGEATGYELISYVREVLKVKTEAIFFSALPPESKRLSYGLQHFQKGEGMQI